MAIQNKVILVIDDDPLCRIFLEKVLTQYGYQVLLATNGEEGLKNSDLCDGILLDISLPDMDGIKVGELLREKKGKNFPIIALTALSVDTLKIQFPNVNEIFTEIYNKPFIIKDLIDVLQYDEMSFEELRGEYIKHIPQTLKQLNFLVHQLHQEFNLETLKTLEKEIHQLGGNSGLFGFPLISQICHLFDQDLLAKIQELEQGKEELSQSWMKQMDAQINVITENLLSIERN